VEAIEDYLDQWHDRYDDDKTEPQERELEFYPQTGFSDDY
jgi:hypothetical protein